MSLNHGIPGQLAQEPQSLAKKKKNPLELKSSVPSARGSVLMERIANAGGVKARGVCWELPWIHPQTPSEFSEQLGKAQIARSS